MNHKITTFDELERRFNNDFFWTHQGPGNSFDNFHKAILYSMKDNENIKDVHDITEEFVDL